ncbi:lytic polysaccharide monooxygenase [Streptomyces sp. NBC_00344]
MVPAALLGLAAVPAAAHGSMTDPVSRVSACFAEGPESPDSAACKALVAAGGTQPLYDWNAVNIADAAGKSKQIIPDGKLCSAGNDKYKGLDLPRADWPSTRLTAGRHTFRYKATAPHKGSFELYLTKDGYDPAKPLKWADLEAKPFATVTDPKLENGDYVFDGTLPAKSGRHLIYSIWQRSDSPEAFYTCSDVVFGRDNGGAGAAASPAPVASAPNAQEIAAGAGRSTVSHHHGSSAGSVPAPEPSHEAGRTAAQGGSAPAPVAATGEQNLAETGGNGGTPYLAIGGVAAVAVGGAALLGAARRRTVPAGRRGR